MSRRVQAVGATVVLAVAAVLTSPSLASRLAFSTDLSDRDVKSLHARTCNGLAMATPEQVEAWLVAQYGMRPDTARQAVKHARC